MLLYFCRKLLAPNISAETNISSETYLFLQKQPSFCRNHSLSAERQFFLSVTAVCRNFLLSVHSLSVSAVTVSVDLYPRSEAVRKSFVHPHRRDQVARQSMSWCQITPSRPIEPALQNPPCPSTQHIARGVTVTRDQYQSTLSHLSVPSNKLTQDSVVVKWDAEGELQF